MTRRPRPAALYCIAAILAAGPAGADEPPRLAELSIALEGARLTDTNADETFPGSITLEARFFLPRLTPDATPPALQPMLQRTTTLGVTAFAGQYDGSADRLRTPFAWQEDARAGGTIFADVYAAPFLPIHVEAGVSAAPRDLELLALGTIGARIWNVRIDVGATVSPHFQGRNHEFTNDLRPSALFQIEAVLLQRIDLRLALRSIDHGAAFEFDCDYFATPRLGLFIGVRGANGEIQPDNEFLRREELLGFRVGFSYWPLPRLGLTALWLPAWSSTGDTGSFDNRLRLTLAARF